MCVILIFEHHVPVYLKTKLNEAYKEGRFLCLQFFYDAEFGIYRLTLHLSWKLFEHLCVLFRILFSTDTPIIFYSVPFGRKGAILYLTYKSAGHREFFFYIYISNFPVLYSPFLIPWRNIWEKWGRLNARCIRFLDNSLTNFAKDKIHFKGSSLYGKLCCVRNIRNGFNL